MGNDLTALMPNIVPNKEQAKGAARWLMTAVSAGFVGYVGAKFHFNTAPIIDYLQSDAVIGIVAMFIPLILSLISNKIKNLIARVDALPKVAGVVVCDKKLAEDIPSETVVPGVVTPNGEVKITK